jgi:hypothetical protein
MSEEIIIRYDGANVFTDLGPTPFISFSQNFIDYKDKWDQITTLTLNGQLVKTATKSLNDLSRDLVEKFKNNYKSLSIIKNNNIIFTSPSVIINSISIEESNWYEVLPYTIIIDVYEQDLFFNYFGIIEPEEKIEFSEENNEIISLKYFVSAKGLKISSQNPIKNAKDWVTNKINNFNPNNNIVIQPIDAKINKGSRFLLVSQSENIDRFNGVYSSELNYIKSTHADSRQNCLFFYNIDIDLNSAENFITVTIRGSLEKNEIQILENEFQSINFYALAKNSIRNIFNNINLNEVPINFSLDKNEQENKLNFSISYNNDLTPNIINDYTVTIDQDDVKFVTNVSLSTKISAKNGGVTEKLEAVKNFFSTFNAYSLANAIYRENTDFSKILNLIPISQTTKINEKLGEIEYTANWTDKYRFYSNNILNIDLTVSYIPSTNVFVPLTSAFVSRAHNVQDLKCAQFAKCEISASAVARPNVELSTVKNELRSIVNRTISKYIQGSEVLKEKDTESTDEYTKTVTVNQSWGFKSNII